MSKFIVLPDVRTDLFAIWQYIADDSVDAADKVVAKIEDAFLKLGDMPGMGHFREDLLDKRHKFWSVHSYLIVYRWQSSPIEIVAVVHGARDLDSFFSRRLL